MVCGHGTFVFLRSPGIYRSLVWPKTRRAGRLSADRLLERQQDFITARASFSVVWQAELVPHPAEIILCNGGPRLAGAAVLDCLQPVNHLFLDLAVMDAIIKPDQRYDQRRPAS